MNIVKI